MARHFPRCGSGYCQAGHHQNGFFFRESRAEGPCLRICEDEAEGASYLTGIRDKIERQMIRLPEDAAERLMRHPCFGEAARGLANGFTAIHKLEPRTAALFATQQRWLMSHAALASYFRAVECGQAGVMLRDVVKLAVKYELCSRNTAIAFFNEALKYGIIEPVIRDNLKGQPPVAPSRGAVEALAGWYVVHLRARDLLDNGHRSERFLAAGPAAVAAIEPIVADALLSAELVRLPRAVYTIFTWMDEGGILMDRLIAAADPVAFAEDKIMTSIVSANALASGSSLSRAHAGRKLAEAEAIGSLGWSGRRGSSPIWISEAFREEYYLNQALKLEIIERALELRAPWILSP